MGGLKNILSQHRSEYCQHYQGNTLNVSEMEFWHYTELYMRSGWTNLVILNKDV